MIATKEKSCVRQAADFEHVRQAASAVVHHLMENDRCQTVMCCGSGKSRVALRTAELLPNCKRVLVLVPSLSLVAQSIRHWKKNCRFVFAMLAVCSDKSVAPDEAVQSTSELNIDVTTEPKAIADFMLRGSRYVIFATYQSCDKIVAAQRLRNVPSFDLAIMDEAHHCAGHEDATYSIPVNGKKIRSNKRNFMTATPRLFGIRARKRANAEGIVLASMDDENKFGKVAHRLPVAEAIDRKIISDYEAVAFFVTDSDVHRVIKANPLLKLAKDKAVLAKHLAQVIALAKAMKKYDLRRVLTFHGSVAKARQFGNEDSPLGFAQLLPHLPADIRPDGTLQTWSVSHHESSGMREGFLGDFARDVPDRRCVISNMRCLGEGVDVPAMDAVVFFDPKGSAIEVNQGIGRALRYAPGKKARIIIPVLVPDNADPEKAIQGTAFAPLHQYIQAMRSHDEQRMQQTVNVLRKQREKNSRSGGGAIDQIIRLERVSEGAKWKLEQFATAIESRILRTSNSTWTKDQILAMADAYHAETGLWPTSNQNDFWCAIDKALREGHKGLPGGDSLHLLLANSGRIISPKLLCKGYIFGRRKIISNEVLKNGQGRTFLVQCQCGHKFEMSAGSIVGTIKRNSDSACTKCVGNLHRRKYIPGQRFGKISVLRAHGDNAFCRCDCGASFRCQSSRLKSMKSCKNCANPRIFISLQESRKTIAHYFRKTGERPTSRSQGLACQELTFHSLDYSLRHGYHGLPGGSSLSKLCDQMGLPQLPKGKRHAN